MLKKLKFSKKVDDIIEDFLKNPENHENNKQTLVNLKAYQNKNKLK